jgi:hypothetical protein
MSVSTQVDPIDQNFLVSVGADIKGPQQSKLIADAAREILAEAEQQNEDAFGSVPPFTATVDGVAGASEDNVRPNGEIVYEFTLLPDIFQWIDQMLISHSPVKSGRYQASHVLLADGSPCDVAAPPTNASQYVFMDTQPYARKIEGLNGKKPESSAAPNGVYEGVAMLAAARFGNVAKIAFGLKPLPGGLASSWATSPSAKALARRHHRRAHALQWLTSQPAIIITPNA